MIYIDSTPDPSGAYPNPKLQPFSGSIALTDEQAEVFFAYNGFVSVEQTEDGVTVTPNVEAWEAWKASLPEDPAPEPTLTERVGAVEETTAELSEALDLLLSGDTGEEVAADEA